MEFFNQLSMQFNEMLTLNPSLIFVIAGAVILFIVLLVMIGSIGKMNKKSKNMLDSMNHMNQTMETLLAEMNVLRGDGAQDAPQGSPVSEGSRDSGEKPRRKRMRGENKEDAANAESQHEEKNGMTESGAESMPESREGGSGRIPSIEEEAAHVAADRVPEPGFSENPAGPETFAGSDTPGIAAEPEISNITVGSENSAGSEIPGADAGTEMTAVPEAIAETAAAAAAPVVAVFQEPVKKRGLFSRKEKPAAAEAPNPAAEEPSGVNLSKEEVSEPDKAIGETVVPEESIEEALRKIEIPTVDENGKPLSRAQQRVALARERKRLMQERGIQPEALEKKQEDNSPAAGEVQNGFTEQEGAVTGFSAPAAEQKMEDAAEAADEMGKNLNSETEVLPRPETKTPQQMNQDILQEIAEQALRKEREKLQGSKLASAGSSTAAELEQSMSHAALGELNPDISSTDGHMPVTSEEPAAEQSDFMSEEPTERMPFAQAEPVPEHMPITLSETKPPEPERMSIPLAETERAPERMPIPPAQPAAEQTDFAPAEPFAERVPFEASESSAEHMPIPPAQPAAEQTDFAPAEPFAERVPFEASESSAERMPFTPAAEAVPERMPLPSDPVQAGLDLNLNQPMSRRPDAPDMDLMLDGNEEAVPETDDRNKAFAERKTMEISREELAHLALECEMHRRQYVEAKQEQAAPQDHSAPEAAQSGYEEVSADSRQPEQQDGLFQSEPLPAETSPEVPAAFEDRVEPPVQDVQGVQTVQDEQDEEAEESLNGMRKALEELRKQKEQLEADLRARIRD